MAETTTHDVLVAQTETAQQLLDYFQTHRTDLEQATSEAQQAYGALAANLRGVVASEMDWHATYDPTEPNPVAGRGGVYTSLQALVNAAPNSSCIEVRLRPNTTIDLVDTYVRLDDQFLYIHTYDPDGVSEADRARLRFPVTVTSANTNANHRFNLFDRAALLFEDVELQLFSRADNALPWAVTGGAAIQPVYGGHTRVTLRRCYVTGSDDASLISGAKGGVVGVGVEDVDLNGNMAVVGRADESIVHISRGANWSVANGALWHRGGTVGGNVTLL